MQSTDEKYMKEAIKQAKKAYAIGEVPIGCVIVYQEGTTGERLTTIPWHMRNWLRSEKQAGK